MLSENKDYPLELGGIRRHLKKMIMLLEAASIEVHEEIYAAYAKV